MLEYLGAMALGAIITIVIGHFLFWYMWTR